MRKATFQDFFDVTPNNGNQKNETIIAKRQVEYGAKKFIKPWRTGTKSQQQITPKGHNKGFRAKSKSTK